MPGENGKAQNYSLWLEKGINGFDRFVLARPEIVEAVRSKEVLDGIIIPINSEYNPITRQHMPGGEYEKQDALRDPQGNVVTNMTAKKIWVAFNPKGEPPSGQVITNDEIANIKQPLIVQNWLVESKLKATIGATVFPRDRLAGYTMNEPVYNTHVMRAEGVAALRAKADAFDQSAMAPAPPRMLNIPPEVLGQAAGSLLFIKTQVTPRASVLPAVPTGAPVVAPGAIEPGIAVPPQEPVVSTPIPTPEEIKPDPKKEVPPLSAEDMVKLTPPAQVKTKGELTAAHDAAAAAMQEIKMAFWTDMSPQSKISPAQIEQVIQAHEKSYPEFGKTLREAYKQMQELKEFSEGPIKVYNEAVNSMFKHYNEKISSFPKRVTEIDERRVAEMHAAAQVKGGPLGEPLPDPFTRARENELRTAEPAFEIAAVADVSPGQTAGKGFKPLS